ncbi:Putative ubiquitin-like-specific protease 1B [Dendrobium catenatum]|uniref:Signal peptidase complex catalytic subunit SEC11 n=1 Tax=Dendrobium catenatum TaxID=906689 RepID=A0A2I0VIM6_9ASPA|nr:Putative ubiquitin-like-specific protease 1B [Dendrobium catenatum]
MGTDGLSSVYVSGMIVTSALIIWKGLMCVTGSESPVVVVLSGSMEPGFKRGDILFLHMSKEPIRAGEIVVFNIDKISSSFSAFSAAVLGCLASDFGQPAGPHWWLFENCCLVAVWGDFHESFHCFLCNFPAEFLLSFGLLFGISKWYQSKINGSKEDECIEICEGGTKFGFSRYDVKLRRSCQHRHGIVLYWRGDSMHMIASEEKDKEANNDSHMPHIDYDRNDNLLEEGNVFSMEVCQSERKGNGNMEDDDLFMEDECPQQNAIVDLHSKIASTSCYNSDAFIDTEDMGFVAKCFPKDDNDTSFCKLLLLGSFMLLYVFPGGFCVGLLLVILAFGVNPLMLLSWWIWTGAVIELVFLLMYFPLVLSYLQAIALVGWRLLWEFGWLYGLVPFGTGRYLSVLVGIDRSYTIYTAGNIQIFRSQIDELLTNQYLDNNHIDAFASLLAEKNKLRPGLYQPFIYVSSLHWGSKKYEMESKQYVSHINKDAVTASNFLLIPINDNDHWTLMVACLKQSTWYFFDSLPNPMHRAVLPLVTNHLHEKTQGCFQTDIRSWKVLEAEGVPTQTNGYDCGIFVCKYMENVIQLNSVKWDLLMNLQAEMPKFRAELAFMLLCSTLK